MLLKNILYIALLPIVLAANGGGLEDDSTDVTKNTQDTGATTTAANTGNTDKTVATPATATAATAATAKTAATVATGATTTIQGTPANTQAAKESDVTITESAVETEATTVATGVTTANTNTNTYGTDSNGNTIWWTPTQSVWWTPSETSWWTPSASAVVTSIISGSHTLVSTISPSIHSSQLSGEITTEKSVVFSLSTYTSGSKVGTIIASYTTENVHTVLKKNSNSTNGANPLMVENDYRMMIYPVMACAGALFLI